jgi:hypothetical protein
MDAAFVTSGGENGGPPAAARRTLLIIASRCLRDAHPALRLGLQNVRFIDSQSV